MPRAARRAPSAVESRSATVTCTSASRARSQAVVRASPSLGTASARAEETGSRRVSPAEELHALRHVARGLG